MKVLLMIALIVTIKQLNERCKPFIPSRHIHSIIKHLVYYTTLGIVKINIFEHFKKYLNSTNIFLETDNNFTQ